MKREIKFRAMSMCKGEHWLYGYIRHYDHNPHTEKWTIYDPSTGIETDIEETTIGQFSGLHDKNGTEIYEGDIVTFMRTPEKRKRRELVRHVVTCYSVCDWIFESLANEVCGMMMANHSDYDSYKFDVIGNIYDTPELAKPYSLNLPERKPRKRKSNKIDVVVKFKI